jgi:eukaryotic-like serine/threonine-protein kinase
MRIHCPTCEHPLDFGGELADADPHVLATISGIDCPNCGLIALEGLTDEEVVGRDLPPDVTMSFLPQQEGERKQIGHFRLDRLLGQGAFGTVWLADDLDLARQVALKLPHARSKDVASLLHEAQSSAHLRHPNIVSIYEVGTQEGQVYIACEYINGITLRDLLTAGRPALHRAVDLVIAIAGALDHAHRNHIVHRDVKPANIRITPSGELKLLDFGVAKLLRDSRTPSPSTTERTFAGPLGTVPFMSPEQLRGGQVDARSDIFAAGAVLYQMVTAQLAFPQRQLGCLVDAVLNQDPIRPRVLNPTVPRALEAVVLKALQKDPAARYRSALELAEALERQPTAVVALRVRQFLRTFRIDRESIREGGLTLV